jgi:hypothetical protein
MSEENQKIYWQVQKLWERFRLHSTPSLSTSYETPVSSSEIEPDQRVFYKLLQQQRAKNIRPKSQDEFEDYCTDSVTASYDKKFKSISWWTENSQQIRFPQLSKFAFEVLSIPAMSDHPERIFSGARRTISWERSKLQPEVVEHVECWKNWYDNNILETVF